MAVQVTAQLQDGEQQPERQPAGPLGWLSQQPAAAAGGMLLAAVPLLPLCLDGGSGGGAGGSGGGGGGGGGAGPNEVFAIAEGSEGE